MPNQRAHGFQIAKTCEKFAELGNDVELWHPYRINDIGDDVFAYYGLKKNFKIRVISVFDPLFLERYIGALAFHLQSMAFFLTVFFSPIEKGRVVFTRDFMVAFLLRARGFEVVYNAHNWSGHRSFFSFLLDKKVKIVCNSEGTCAKLKDRGFENSLVARNGVEISEFTTVESKSDIKKKLSIPADKKVIMYAGNLYRWKGVDVILEAVKLPEVKSLNAVVFIVGGDENDVEAYKKKVEEENISGVAFSGHVLRKDIPFYLKAADVLILPNSAESEESVSYTSPIKMFEYMASGVPIIASDLPSIREVLNDRSCFFVKPDRPEELGGAISKMLSDSSLCKRIADQALLDVKKYTWDEYAKKIILFLEKN